MKTHARGKTVTNRKGSSAQGKAAIVPAVADKKVEDICFISFPVVGTCGQSEIKSGKLIPHTISKGLL